MTDRPRGRDQHRQRRARRPRRIRRARELRRRRHGEPRRCATASRSCSRGTSCARASRSPADEERRRVDLYVVIEYGTNLTEVSHNLANRVRYVLTHTADVPVARVDVHVRASRSAQAK